MPRRHNAAPVRARLLASCAALGLGALAAAPAHADGLLFVTSSAYATPPSTIAIGQALPDSAGVAAIATAAYPGVFANDTVDGNFGITSPITLTSYLAKSRGQKGITAGSPLERLDLTALTGAVTSFSSKSELGLQLSSDGSALTLMGYVAKRNSIDVSNSNTPDNVDPTNDDTAPSAYRAVLQVNLTGGLVTGANATAVDSYSGNNGRGAVLATNVNGTGATEYLLVGNAGNGSGIPPTNIVNDTGVQAIAPGATSPVSTVIGAQQGTPGVKTGFQYGFSVAQIGDVADKSGKDDNFRGMTVFGNTLYVTKGSGGNGVDTVYQVTPAGGGLPTAATGSTTQISILPGLPTGLAANIVSGDPTTEFFPFGIWFANAHTLYVADEGSQDLTADPNAGLQKWILRNNTWKLAYVIQAGLNLDQPYSVANYPSADNPATTGLRHVTGAVTGNTVTLFATTSTFSNLGDPGADPNAVVRVVDKLDATTLPVGEAFTIVKQPAARVVYRGVAYVPMD